MASWEALYRSLRDRDRDGVLDRSDQCPDKARGGRAVRSKLTRLIDPFFFDDAALQAQVLIDPRDVFIAPGRDLIERWPYVASTRHIPWQSLSVSIRCVGALQIHCRTDFALSQASEYETRGGLS